MKTKKELNKNGGMITKKRIISLFLAVFMIVGMIPLSAMTAFAAEETDNQYVVRSWDGTKVTEELADIPTAATLLTSDMTTWESGWYVVSGDVTLSSVTVADEHHEEETSEDIIPEPADVKLILKDGCHLAVEGTIDVTGEDSLTIFAQKGETGTLTVGKGIGGGSRISCGNITIHGGRIVTTGDSNRAGIGGGYRGTAGNVTIYGGNVTATGANNASGIGDGYLGFGGGDVKIYGGKVTVKAGEGAQAFKVDSITIGDELVVNDADKNAVIPQTDKTWTDILTGAFYTVMPVVNYQWFDAYAWKLFPAECAAYTPVTEDIGAWTEGWYVVDTDVTIDRYLDISGDVNLILADGKTLTVDGEIYAGGTLNIYAQSDGSRMGSLIADGINTSTGKDLGIYGGNVTTRGISSRGSIVFGGGVTTATNTAYGAVSADNTIEFYGGTLIATGHSGGIGAGGDISIHLGNVIASGEYGIYSKGNILIYGNNVTATGTGTSGIGIRALGTLTVKAGVVTAQGPGKAVWAKGGIYVGSSMAAYDRANERIPKPEGFNPDWSSTLTDKYCRFMKADAVPYLYYDEESRAFKDELCPAYKEIDEDTTEWKASDGSGEKWYTVNGEVAIDERVTVSGNVHLILTDGCKLTVKEGITVEDGNSLTIYSQNGGTGVLNAGDRLLINSGIGDSVGQTAGTVNIHGGNVTAFSNISAGIGGGSGTKGSNGGDGGTVNIYGGTVTAASTYGAAIGGGSGGKDTVDSIDPDGNGGSGGTVNIYGGNVTATTLVGAAIGGGGSGEKGGNGGDGGTVHICGGTVTASTRFGAGIGYGSGKISAGDGGEVTITGGTVTATGMTAIGAYSLTLGDGISFKAGEDQDNITVIGDKNNASDAFDQPYFRSEPAPVTYPLKIRSASLRISEDINVVYAAEVSESCTDPYMVFSFNGQEITVDSYTVNGEGLYCFEFEDVNPQCMDDNISATLYATVDGCTASVTKEEYSVRAYCVSMLAKANDELLVTLLSDLLTYGAAAQTYTGYKTGDLVTNGLAVLPSTFSALEGKKASFTGESDAKIDWISATLVLSNDLATRFSFIADSTDGLSVDVTINGRTQTFTEFTDLGNGRYAVTFDGIMATEFDDTVTAKFYRDGAQLGAAVNYSVNTYICGTQNCENTNLQALVRALYNYGASAKTYADANK